MKRLLLLAFLSIVAIPLQASSWPNEPKDSVVIVDSDFAKGDLGSGWFDVYKSAAFASFTDAPESPPFALDTFMEVDSHTGNGQWVVDLKNAKRLFIGMWWSTNADFMGYSNNNNKMVFARRPEVDNNFLVWQGMPGEPKTIKWYGQMAYDNCGHPGEHGMAFSKGDGTGWFEPNGPSNGTVAAGSGWHRIEIYLKTSETKESRDGAVRWWLDGVLVGDYPTINLSPGGLQEFQINHAWDGSLSGRDLTKRWDHYWDHVKLSVPQSDPEGIPPSVPKSAPPVDPAHAHPLRMDDLPKEEDRPADADKSDRTDASDQ